MRLSMENRQQQYPPVNPIIVIPARNEAISITSVIRGIKSKTNIPVIVIDDDSQDNTLELARQAGAIAIKLSLPLGAWGATQTGIRYALAHGYSIVVAMDADGQHESSYLNDILRPLLDGSADAVIGACPQRASMARQIAWTIFRWLSGFNLTDLTSGFRAYNSASIEVLSSPEATMLDYQDLGVLIMLSKNNLKIVEVPVQMKPRQDGPSRIFASWWAVIWYLAQTTILCIARWEKGREKGRCST